MEAFWQFAGNFWWLVFPLFGMAGAVGNAWSRASRRRHKRRLEVIRAKGEAKAAQLAARSAGQHADDETDVPSRKMRLKRLLDTHDEVTRRWLDYELDVSKLIAYPAMSDGRRPLTAAFLRAKKAADALRPDSEDTKLDAEGLAEYRDAVHDFEVAFDVAEQDARRLRDSTFSETERKRLDRAQHLLHVAIDESATASERQIAYKRVREELDGLIALSDDAIDILEKKVAPELESGISRPERAPQGESEGEGEGEARPGPGHARGPAPAPRPDADVRPGRTPDPTPPARPDAETRPEPMPRRTPGT